MDRCECEHTNHFGTEDHRRVNHAHRYNAVVKSALPVKTSYGAFSLCEDCRTRGHLTEVK